MPVALTWVNAVSPCVAKTPVRLTHVNESSAIGCNLPGLADVEAHNRAQAP